MKKGSVVEQMRHEWEEKYKEEGEDVSLQNVPPVEWKSSGNGGQCTEGYWVLEPEGPWLLDFTAVHREIAKLIPQDAAAPQIGCWALSMGKAEVRSPIQLKNALCHACDYVGEAVVHFKVEGHRAVPVSSSFEQGQ